VSSPSGVEHDPAATLLKLPREQSRWMMTRARLARVPLGLAAAAPLVSGVLLVWQAWLLAGVLDRAIVGGAARADLAPAIIGIVLLVLARACLAWLGERAGALAAERIKHQLRLQLFGHLLAQGPQWSRTRPSGELASAVVDQVEAFDGFFAKYLPAMGAAAVLPVAFAVVVLPSDVVSGLLLLVTAPLIPVFMALVGWGAEAASRRHMQALARLSGFFADRLRGLATLKLFGRAQAEADSVVAASEGVRRRTLSVLRIAFLSSAVLEFFAALGVAGVAVYIGLTYLGYLDVRSVPLTLSAGFFCLLMAPEVYAPLRQFAAHYHDRGAARAAVAQLAQVFDGLPPDDAAPAHATREPPAGALSLRLRQLEVLAPGRRAPVLAGLDLDLRAGAQVALMGESGAGKTTLLEAIAGLRSAGGDVLLGGVPLAQWDARRLHERVAVIGQKPYIMAGTLADNIRLARPEAADAEVAEAARLAGVMDFAEALPRGLDTPLDSRGHGLSGGQAQRLALARLFLRDPDLILLDEPTAHLDAATQARVLDAVLAFAAGRTLILSTHAEAVAQRLPAVWRLRDGRMEVSS